MARGKRFRTHYDNLQISERASPAVIRAAYRALSQKWHPDKNPDDRERAERVAQIINEAYRVLSDPKARREHDEWIRRKRSRQEADSHNTDSGDDDAHEESSSQSPNFSETRDGTLFAAATNGTTDDVRRATELGGRVDAFDSDGMTALMWAASRNIDPKVIDELVRCGSDVNSRDNQGCTALHYAGRRNGPKVVHNLLKYGADASLRDASGRNAHETAFDNTAINCADGCYALREMEASFAGVRRGGSARKEPEKGAWDLLFAVIVWGAIIWWWFIR